MTKDTSSPQPQAVERKNTNLTNEKESNLEKREENGLLVDRNKKENSISNSKNHVVKGYQEHEADKRGQRQGGIDKKGEKEKDKKGDL